MRSTTSIPATPSVRPRTGVADLLQYDQHLDCADLAKRHRTTVAHIHKLRSQAPHRLPPPLDLGGKKLLWRLVDVEAWEAEKVAGAVPPRLGRKSTAAKAREEAAYALHKGRSYEEPR